MTRLTVPRYDDPRGFRVVAVKPIGNDKEENVLRAPCGCECIARRYRSSVHVGSGYHSGVLYECETHSPPEDDGAA